jgi:hypothetical protein
MLSFTFEFSFYSIRNYGRAEPSEHPLKELFKAKSLQQEAIEPRIRNSNSITTQNSCKI